MATLSINTVRRTLQHVMAYYSISQYTIVHYRLTKGMGLCTSGVCPGALLMWLRNSRNLTKLEMRDDSREALSWLL